MNVTLLGVQMIATRCVLGPAIPRREWRILVLATGAPDRRIGQRHQSADSWSGYVWRTGTSDE